MNMKPITFVRNVFKFRKFLSMFRAWNGDSSFEYFMRDYIDNMIHFYEKEVSLGCCDDEKLNQLYTLKDMIEPAFIEDYYLRAISNKDLDFKSFTTETDSGEIGFGIKKPYWTKEELVESKNKYLEARKAFFDYFEQNYTNWWE